MKKSIPTWKIDQISTQQDIYISKKAQKVKQYILATYQDTNLSDFDKYLLVESKFNKQFYDLKLMDQTNV